MGINDIVPALALVASVVIAFVGWSRAAKKDREFHLFQKRLERRLLMLDLIFDAVSPLLNDKANDPTLPERLASAHRSVQLFGYIEEILNFETLIKAIESADVPAANSALNVLVPNIRATLRRELGYADKDIDVTNVRRSVTNYEGVDI